MSECYTTGGDTWQPLVGFDISAQTLTPLQSHIVTFIDLDLWLFGYTPPLVYLTECDASHEPIGPILSDAHAIEPFIYLPPAKRRVRFQLDTPISLVRGHIYAIQIRKALNHIGPNNQCLYDKDDATYPRGHIIFSNDGGNTWIHFTNHDFMFCEFGNPPLPKPEPAPPISFFASLNILFFHLATSITISLATSVPCHLNCLYSEIEPRKHRRSRTTRGVDLPWGNYYCFVAWKVVEQTEPGDTLYHTFEMPNWTYCQTKWFTFRGTINDITAPSIGPIFKHHHSGVSHASSILRPNAQGDLWNATPSPSQPPSDHWKNIDDIIPDEDTTLVRSGAYPQSCAPLDLYHLEDPGFNLAPIHSIIQHGRFRLNDPLSTKKSAGMPIKTHGIVYHYTGCPFLAGITWLDYQHTWLTNPNTSAPWTWQEIKDLQIGLALYNPKRPVSPWLNAWTACTQTYLEVKSYS